MHSIIWTRMLSSKVLVILALDFLPLPPVSQRAC